MSEAAAINDPPTLNLSADDFPYATFFPGIEIKVYRVDLNANAYTLVSRFAPGTTLPKHKHFGEVQAYTIRGRWHYLEYDWYATAGTVVYEPALSTHTLHVPEEEKEPAEVFFTVSGGMALLNDKGQVMMLEDAAQMLQRYKDALKYGGHDTVPPIVVLGQEK